ncbi:unnamed protein product [Dicrocoelium dendriticum]|nr:unnamed protein product [Dicrocoelium dendriticum]
MSSISSFAFCVPVLLTMTSPLLVIESVQVLYFSTHVNLSTLLKHLNVTPVGFVGVFDTLYPGDHFSEYQIFAKYLKNTKEINVYHMLHTQDILPSENIFKKFNLSYIELPYYMLFHRGNSSPVTYRSSWKSEDILQWVTEVTGLHLPLPGCIASLDAVAHKARSANPEQIRRELLPEIDHISASEQHINSDLAKFYRIVMEKLLTLGPSFLTTESVRLRKLVDSEVADWQKDSLKKRLNILTQFMKPKDGFAIKTEL